MDETKKKALDMLMAHNTAVVSTVSPEGKPEAALVLYTIDKDFNFHFLTKNQTRKAQNLAKNKSIAIVVNDLDISETLQFEGVAEVVEDSKEAVRVIDQWVKTNVSNKKLWPPPLFKLDKGSILIFHVKIDWMRFSNFSWMHEAIEELK